MRMTIISRMSNQFTESTQGIPLSLTIRPAGGLPGDYSYSTDSSALMRMLHKGTDLSLDALKRFESQLPSRVGAQLKSVELSEALLTEIGYFVD